MIHQIFNKPLAVIVAVSVLFALSLGKEPLTLKGQVVGPDGKPVANATVAYTWKVQPGSKGPVYEPVNPAKSGSDGEFSLSWPGDSKASYPIVVMDSARELGCLTRVKGVDEFVTLHLVPLTKVHLNLECEIPLKQAALLIHSEEGMPLWHLSGFSKGVLPLPPGNYSMTVMCARTRFEGSKKVVVPEGNLDLGTWTLKPAPFALMGNDAPELSGFSSIRGLPQEFHLASQRGKWVIIEFWSYG